MPNFIVLVNVDLMAEISVSNRIGDLHNFRHRTGNAQRDKPHKGESGNIHNNNGEHGFHHLPEQLGRHKFLGNIDFNPP